MAEFDRTKTPKYKAVADFVIEQIKEGALKPGDQLPSQSAWKKLFGVDYGTLRGGYLVLRSMGVIEGRQGQGVFVKDNESGTQIGKEA